MKNGLRLCGFLLICMGFICCATAQPKGKGSGASAKNATILPGAYTMDDYLPMLQGKRVALLINQTSRVGEQLLLDTLLSRKVNIVKVFVPEHGFRGTADAGSHVGNSKDEKTGVAIVSLYGNNKKPKKEQLADVDVVIYDLQDVGVRFYTYISSLEYMMQACAESGKELLVLDRPNPNGYYVDGPVLDTSLRSFVGMQPIPVVYGMTVGEYAKMLQGEGWAKGTSKLAMQIISCKNYDHEKRYSLPVPPSPNLRTDGAVMLYPSVCFFEGTPVSVGRGTDKPFEQWGHPAFKGKTDYSFVPKTMTGATKPVLEGQTCYGRYIQADISKVGKVIYGRLQLKWLIEAYNWYPEKEKFFTDFFEKLAGTKKLRQQIIAGKTEEEIRQSWAADIAAFKKVRKKYLLYPDFE